MKYFGNMFYIYLFIIIINTFINILFLIGMDGITSLISNMEINDYEINLFKIHQGNENSGLIPEESVSATKPSESEKKLELDSTDGDKEHKCKKKDLNPLYDIHKRLMLADKSHFPSYFQKNILPKISEDVPVYGNKLVTFKSSSLLQNRNLPGMSIDIPKSTSMGKLTELHKAINGADEAIKLYDSQFIKFNKVLSGIKNGTEEFYPNEAKPLMETYVDLVTKLSHQQKIMANEAINKLHKLDPSFSRDLYPVDNKDGETGTVTRTVTRIGKETSHDTGTSAVTVKKDKVLGVSSMKR